VGNIGADPRQRPPIATRSPLAMKRKTNFAGGSASPQRSARRHGGGSIVKSSIRRSLLRGISALLSIRMNFSMLGFRSLTARGLSREPPRNGDRAAGENQKTARAVHCFRPPSRFEPETPRNGPILGCAGDRELAVNERRPQRALAATEPGLRGRSGFEPRNQCPALCLNFRQGKEVGPIGLFLPGTARRNEKAHALFVYSPTVSFEKKFRPAGPIPDWGPGGFFGARNFSFPFHEGPAGFSRAHNLGGCTRASPSSPARRWNKFERGAAFSPWRVKQR